MLSLSTLQVDRKGIKGKNRSAVEREERENQGKERERETH